MYTTAAAVGQMRGGLVLSADGDESNVVTAPYTGDDVVFMGRSENENDFCFFYEFLFRKFRLRLPLSSFQKTILTTLNVAPTQLHPNSWCFIRCYEIMCKGVDIKPLAGAFFYFFEHKLSRRSSWASLSSVQGRGLLNLFQSSLKKFHISFFWVRSSRFIDGESEDVADQSVDILDGYLNYWTTDLVPYGNLKLEELPDDDQRQVVRLEVHQKLPFGRLFDIEHDVVELRHYLGQMAMSKAEMARRFAEKMKRQNAKKAGLGEKLTAEGVGDSGVAQFSSTHPKSTQPIPLTVENVEGTAHQTRKRPRAEGDHSVLQLSDTEDEVLADVTSRKNSNMSLWHEHFPHEMLLRKSLYPADASRYESVEMMDVMKELSTLTTRLGALLVVAHDKNDAIVAKGDDTEKKLAASEQLVADLRQEMRVLADEKADLEKLKVDFAKEKADWENEMLTLTNEVNRYKGKSERLESENKRLEKVVEMVHRLIDENVEAVKAEAVDKFIEGFDACQSQMLLLYPDLDVTQIGYFKEVKDEMLVDPLD